MSRSDSPSISVTVPSLYLLPWRPLTSFASSSSFYFCDITQISHNNPLLRINISELYLLYFCSHTIYVLCIYLNVLHCGMSVVGVHTDGRFCCCVCSSCGPTAGLSIFGCSRACVCVLQKLTQFMWRALSPWQHMCLPKRRLRHDSLFMSVS